MHRLYVDYFGVNRWTTTLMCRRMVRSLRIRAIERNRFRWAFMFNDILGRGSEMSRMERCEYPEWWGEVERLTREPCSICLTTIRLRSVWFVSCGHRVCGPCGVEVARRSQGGGIRCPLCRADTSAILTRPRQFGHGRHCLCRRLQNP